MKRLVLMLAGASVVGCGNAEAVPVRLVLGLKNSCPAATRGYSIRCVDALVVGLVGADGQKFKSQCTTITAPYDSMQALLSSTSVVEVLRDVRARAAVRLELRAYHAVAGVAACTALDDRHLLFWGMSPISDFTDRGVDEVTVEIECRPECDCDDLANPAAAARCPAAMPPGVCAPTENRPCRKQCETSDNCWGGLLSCEIATCDDDVPSTAKCCAAEAGRICSPCAYDAECESSYCVHNQSGLTNPRNPDEWFCADPCPPLPDVTPCPGDMGCRRLGNGVFERASASAAP